MTTHDKAQETTFYEKLRNKSGLDLRDNRGKRHNLALVRELLQDMKSIITIEMSVLKKTNCVQPSSPSQSYRPI